MSDSELESFQEESCYTCGIDLGDCEESTYVTGFSSTSEEMRMFCSKKCCEKNTKYVSPHIEEGNVFTVPVKGKCDGQVINGVASFDMNGVIRINLNNPDMCATIVVPKAFLELVSALYTPDGEGELQEGGGIHLTL